jgi:isopenicillin N synthase-like dioxygenase
MSLISYPLAKITPAQVLRSFSVQQCVVLRGALPREIVTTAARTFRKLMEDEQLLLEYPFDPDRRLGYTPPGVESLQRDQTNRDWNRAMFDFSPTLYFDQPSIVALYRQTERVCEQVIKLLAEEQETPLATLPRGEHTLRTAQYLVHDTTQTDVLFPEHRDFSLLTAFIGSDEPGLEVRVGESWEPAEIRVTDVLVGIGTPFTQFHPDLTALWHRVMGGADRRLSSFLFFDLREDVVLPKTGEMYGDMMARVLKKVRTHA